MDPNYPYQNGNNSYEPQPQQRGGGKRTAGNENRVNSGSYTGTVLPVTGKPTDEIRVSPLKNKPGVVVHFTLLIEEPGPVDQYGQSKPKRVYRRVTAFSNGKISEDLLRSLRPGDVVKISASDIDEPYDKRDGTKGYREAKLAYYIEVLSRPAMQQQGSGYPAPAAQPAQGGYYPQGAPAQQYGAPGYGQQPPAGYQSPAGQPQYFPQGTPAPAQQYGQQQPQYGGYPAPQGPPPTAQPPQQQGGYRQAPPAAAPQPQWTPGAAQQRNGQAVPQGAWQQAPPATPPYYQAPGPAFPPPSDEDMPADIAAGVKELDV